MWARRIFARCSRLRWIVLSFTVVYIIILYYYLSDDDISSTVKSVNGVSNLAAKVRDSGRRKDVDDPSLLLKKYSFCRNLDRSDDQHADADCENVLQPKDVFISVKTTKIYHNTRLPVILGTWQQLFPEIVYFFTDEDDELLSRKTDSHLINTNCETTYLDGSLRCKMAAELEKFLETEAKWFCHVDDDNYVNVPELFRLLERYDYSGDWFLGRWSAERPVELFYMTELKVEEHLRFSFATGGAGFCLTKALVLRMKPYVSGGRFAALGEQLRFPDDLLVGYIIEHRLKVNLTVIREFHSHLEDLQKYDASSLRHQITISYSDENTITIDGFPRSQDPTRFFSLHCYLFPKYAAPCP